MRERGGGGGSHIFSSQSNYRCRARYICHKAKNMFSVIFSGQSTLVLIFYSTSPLQASPPCFPGPRLIPSPGARKLYSVRHIPETRDHGRHHNVEKAHPQPHDSQQVMTRSHPAERHLRLSRLLLRAPCQPRQRASNRATAAFHCTCFQTLNPKT